MLGRFFKSRGVKPLSYDEAREIARHEDAKVRADLARRTDVQPEILYFLAEDPSPEVRRAIAENGATPPQADLILARDEDTAVRGGLAEKISRVAPDLSADERDKVGRMARQILEILTRDQVTRVRQILSEALKDVADAPPEVIRRLAWDSEILVSGPVLEFSPLLTDDDLLEIIRARPAEGGVGAISRRAALSETISDAVVASDDVEAIAFLLGNESAQIREETLDKVIDRAVDVDAWHLPLVERPALPKGAAERLARFVADNLLRKLSDRADLDPESLEAVRKVVDRRLKEGGEGTTVDEENVLDEAAALWAAGKLDEQTFVAAVKERQRERAVAMLSVMTGIPVGSIGKALASQSAKGAMALCWKAGLGAKTAELVQQHLAGIQVSGVLRASGGAYPLEREDLEWQLEFISGL